MSGDEGYDHIGYDIRGNKIAKPTKSALEMLLERVDDPEQSLWLQDCGALRCLSLQGNPAALLLDYQQQVRRAG